jgi:hypothetical protein
MSGTLYDFAAVSAGEASRAFWMRAEKIIGSCQALSSICTIQRDRPEVPPAPSGPGRGRRMRHGHGGAIREDRSESPVSSAASTYGVPQTRAFPIELTFGPGQIGRQRALVRAPVDAAHGECGLAPKGAFAAPESASDTERGVGA